MKTRGIDDWGIESHEPCASIARTPAYRKERQKRAYELQWAQITKARAERKKVARKQAAREKAAALQLTGAAKSPGGVSRAQSPPGANSASGTPVPVSDPGCAHRTWLSRSLF